MRTAKYLFRMGGFLLMPAFALQLAAQSSTSRYTNHRGDQVITTRSGTPGARTTNRTVTTPDGRTYSSNTTESRARGNSSRTTVVTNPDGQVKTYQDHSTWGNGTYNNTQSRTGYDGTTRTRATTRSGRNVTKSFTGRNGETRTWSGRDYRR